MEPRGRDALARPADAGAGAGGGCNFPGALSKRARERDPERGASSLPPAPPAPAARSGAPAAPSDPSALPWPAPRGPCPPIPVRGRNGARRRSAPKCLLGSGPQKQSLGGPAGLGRAARSSARRAPRVAGESCRGSPSGARAVTVPRRRVLACHLPPRGAARPRGEPGACQLRARGAWTASGLCQVDVVRSRSQAEGERPVVQKLRERWGLSAAQKSPGRPGAPGVPQCPWGPATAPNSKACVKEDKLGRTFLTGRIGDSDPQYF